MSNTKLEADIEVEAQPPLMFLDCFKFCVRFLEPGYFLPVASICKECQREYLEQRIDDRITYIRHISNSPGPSLNLVRWAVDNKCPRPRHDMWCYTPQRRFPIAMLTVGAEQGLLHPFEWVVSHDVDNVKIDLFSPSQFELRTACRAASDLAAEKGHGCIVVFLRLHGLHGTWGNEATFAAAAGGDLQRLQHLYSSGYCVQIEALVESARCGHADVAKWLFESALDSKYRTPEMVFPVFRAAAGAGELVLLEYIVNLEYLRTAYTPISYYFREACDDAARARKLEVVEWFRSRGAQGSWRSEETQLAAEEGRLNDLKSLYAQGCGLTPQAHVYASREKHYDVMLWLRDVMPPRLFFNVENDLKVRYAIERSRLDDLRDLYAKEYLIGLALEKGRFATVRWLHEEKGCVLSANTFNHGILPEDWDFLRWLRSPAVNVEFSRYSRELTSRAASIGRFDQLTWLVSEGCTMDVDIVESIANSRNVEMLEWVKHKMEGRLQLSGRCIEAAASNGHLDMLKRLEDMGCPMPENSIYPIYSSGMGDAARGGHWEVVYWMRKRGCEWKDRSNIARHACEQGNLEALQWLIEEEHVWNAECSFNYATEQKFTAMAQWIDNVHLAPRRDEQGRIRPDGGPSWEDDDAWDYPNLNY